MYKLYNGDCLDVMKNIPNGSIDMILCDLPYGTTQCKWECNYKNSVIKAISDMEKLEKIEKVLDKTLIAKEPYKAKIEAIEQIVKG